MKKQENLFVIYILFFVILICYGCRPAESVRAEPTDNNGLVKETDAHVIEPLIKGLENVDYNSANEAYMRLFLKGKAAIPHLIANADNTKTFHGNIDINQLSSLITEPTVGVISLYIIECVLNPDLYPHPHSTARIWESKEPVVGIKTEPVVLHKAKKAYEIWWKRNKNKPLKEIIETDGNPLKDTGLHWHGGTAKNSKQGGMGSLPHHLSELVKT